MKKPKVQTPHTVAHRVWAPFPTIAAARLSSLATVSEIRECLSKLETSLLGVSCIALCGSLARLDASNVSDMDLIVVLDDDVLANDAAKDAAMQAIWNCLAPLGLEHPQADGIFATPTSRQELCDGPRGIVAEDVAVFSKRIHLLLESRSVFRDEACYELQREILLRYAQHPFAKRPGELWRYLTDDLIRYWRSYSVWRHWDVKTSAGGWYMRNVKLRHSRLLTYTSLLLACVVDGLEKPSVGSLLKQTSLTPLERLQRIDQRYKAHTFDAVCSHYDCFLKTIRDSEFRQRLQQTTLSNAREALVEVPEGFAEILDNSDRLRAALVKLIRALPHAASDRVLADLLF